MIRAPLSNRRHIAVAAVIMQLCLGAVHGWSVFQKPLTVLTQWTISETALAYTFAHGIPWGWGASSAAFDWTVWVRELSRP